MAEAEFGFDREARPAGLAVEDGEAFARANRDDGLLLAGLCLGADLLAARDEGISLDTQEGP